MPDTRWVLIANPISGGGKRRPLVQQAADRLRSAGHIVDVRWTDKRGDAEQMAVAAVRAGIRHIVACGGDGTIHEVVNGIMAQNPAVRADVALGILPLGRANDFATALKIPHTMPAMLGPLLTGHPRVIDLGKVNDRYFTTVSTLGFDSAVAQYVEDGRVPKFLKGTPAYLYATLVILMRYKSVWIKLNGDLKPFEGSIFLAASGNTPTYGGKMKIAPTAVMDDGQLDLCLVRAAHKLEVLQMLPRVFSGDHTKHPKVSMHRFSKMEISSRVPVTIWADGEPICQTPAVIQVAPKALTVLAL